MSATWRRNVIAGAVIGIAVSLIAGFVNGVLVIRAGGSNTGHAYLLAGGKDISPLQIVAWLVLGVLAGSALRSVYRRWTAGWRPWLASLVVAAATSVVISQAEGAAYADDGGWEECQLPGEGAGCLLPAFASSPTVSVTIFAGFIVGWLRPTYPAQAWAFAKRFVQERILQRKQEPSENLVSAAVTASVTMGRSRVAVHEDVDDTETHAVRFVFHSGPARYSVTDEDQR